MSEHEHDHDHEEKKKNKQVLLLKPHQILFREDDVAESLFIIKSGIIRLFRPTKGGQVELATVRGGEVIGEMAFFEEGNRRRSCSAEAIVTSELVEITFESFKRVCDGLHPWFQTIINTLIARVIKLNATVKRFEESSVTLSYGKGRGSAFKFFKDLDIIKLLTIFYLAIKDHEKDNEATVPESLLEYYAEDIFSISESRFHEFVSLMADLDIMEVQKDESGKLTNIHIDDISVFKKTFLFMNRERHLAEEKKIHLTHNCIMLLEGIIDKDNRVPYQARKATINIQTIVDELKGKKIHLTLGDFTEAVKHGLMEDPYLDQQKNLVCRVDLDKVHDLLPALRVSEAFARLNEMKRGE